MFWASVPYQGAKPCFAEPPSKKGHEDFFDPSTTGHLRQLSHFFSQSPCLLFNTNCLHPHEIFQIFRFSHLQIFGFSKSKSRSKSKSKSKFRFDRSNPSLTGQIQKSKNHERPRHRRGTLHPHAIFQIFRFSDFFRF